MRNRGDGACGRLVLFELGSTWRLGWPGERRGETERAVYYFNKVSLLTQDEALVLGNAEILARLLIGLQTCAVSLIGGETVKCNQAPSHIVGAFMWKKIADEVAAAAGNDAAPILGVDSEPVQLKRVDLVTNQASYGHQVLPRVRGR
jgi:hypothetical protein